MGLDRKYGRVHVERGTIGDDEPVVVFRAQDALLLAVLDWYRYMSEATGSPKAHLDAIMATREEVMAWQDTHDVKVPGRPFDYGKYPDLEEESEQT